MTVNPRNTRKRGHAFARIAAAQIQATSTCGGGSTAQSHFDLVVSDTDCLERAICEYRETSCDDSSFEELSFESQQRILRRAQEIKDCQHRLKAVAGVRHPHCFLGCWSSRLSVAKGILDLTDQRSMKAIAYRYLLSQRAYKIFR